MAKRGRPEGSGTKFKCSKHCYESNNRDSLELLSLAVIAQAAEDFRKNIDKEGCKRFLNVNNVTFQTMCAIIDIDPTYVINNMRKE